MKKEMKSPLCRIAAAACALVLLLCSLAVPAFAAQNYIVFFLALDKSGEMIWAGPAVMYQGETDVVVVVDMDEDALSNAAVCGVYIDDDHVYTAELSKDDGHSQLFLVDIPSSDSRILEVSTRKSDYEYAWVWYDLDLDEHTGGTAAFSSSDDRWNVNDDDFFAAEEAGNIYYPVLIMDGDKLVAYYCESVVTTILADSSSSGSGSSSGGSGSSSSSTNGGSSSSRGRTTPDTPDTPEENNWSQYLPYAAIGAVIVIAVVLVQKKKKPSNPNNDVQAPVSIDPPVNSPVNVQPPVVPPVTPAAIPEQPPVNVQPPIEPPQVIPATTPAVQASQTQLYLHGKGGPMDGRYYEVTKNVITIGRNPDNTIQYPAKTPGVSRKHCQIFWNQGVIMLMDCGSTSGTFLRGKGQLPPQAPVALKVGDTFYLGEKNNAFELIMK